MNQPPVPYFPRRAAMVTYEPLFKNIMIVAGVSRRARPAAVIIRPTESPGRPLSNPQDIAD
jgi:hypothetical protein